MLVICAYCGKVIREKEPLENKMISHGCCKECYATEIEKLKKTEDSRDETKDKETDRGK